MLYPTFHFKNVETNMSYIVKVKITKKSIGYQIHTEEAKSSAFNVFARPKSPGEKSKREKENAGLHQKNRLYPSSLQ